jgi:hypothetical protein
MQEVVHYISLSKQPISKNNKLEEYLGKHVRVFKLYMIQK